MNPTRLAPEVEALFKEFAAALTKHRAWTDLRRYLEQFTGQAFSEFTGYRGHDSEILMALRAKWLARLEFQQGIESFIDDQHGRQEEIADALGVDLEQLELRSDIEVYE